MQGRMNAFLPSGKAFHLVGFLLIFSEEIILYHTLLYRSEERTEKRHRGCCGGAAALPSASRGLRGPSPTLALRRPPRGPGCARTCSPPAAAPSPCSGLFPPAPL